MGIEEEKNFPADREHYYPYYSISATIAVNMIMSAASGGTLAVAIAIWAQVCTDVKYCGMRLAVSTVYSRCVLEVSQ